jgi:hypothetical protein
MTKAQQTKKNRTPNPRKMTAIELQLFKDFIFDRADGMCQCGCGNVGEDFHHSESGYKKDDKSLVLICREEHTIIHHGTDTDRAERLKVLTKGIGRDNWRAYCQ